MITIQHEGSLITVGIYGEFTVTDYRQFETEVLETLRLSGKVDLLLDLRDMQSYTLDVAWEDVRFVRKHAHDFRRVAIISDDQWHVWLAWVTRVLVDADLQVFTDEGIARDWLAAHPEPLPRQLNRTTLVSVADLARHLGDPGLVIFDCRHELTNPDFGPEAYARSHIPGARFAHLDRDLSSRPTGSNGRHPLPDTDVFVRWLGRMGVSNAAQVIAYDSAGGTYAARLWWMLKHWLGHARVAVLDGGWDVWVKTGHPVTREVPEPIPATFQGHPSPEACVDVAFVQAHLGKPDMQVVDARAPDRFRGKNETIDPVGGHIPGAVNRFFRDNLDAQGFFRPPAELRAAFTPLVGDRALHQVVHQCGSGVSACHNLLAMDIAGLGGSKLYPGSWSEWCSDPSRPVAT
jgi:thiosulfate/3-mercaptopyruvate sulfurtransferase